METKYKPGEVVTERIRPTNKLTIVRWENGVYYCKPTWGVQLRKDLVYLERDLTDGRAK
ncbi:MAG TPA: hypothetical protein VF141_16030 [Chryseolinea sp.]